MKTEELSKFKTQIWITRISRINSERRLREKENFIQTVNIYYSCATIFFSIQSLFVTDVYLNQFTLFMTIALLVAILYLSGMKYVERANDFREVYTQLQLLEFKIEGLAEIQTDIFRNIQERYCELMVLGENHTSYDYNKAVYQYRGRDLKDRWKDIKCIFYWQCILRIIIKIIVIVFPIVLGVLLIMRGSVNAGSKAMVVSFFREAFKGALL